MSWKLPGTYDIRAEEVSIKSVTSLVLMDRGERPRARCRGALRVSQYQPRARRGRYADSSGRGARSWAFRLPGP